MIKQLRDHHLISQASLLHQLLINGDGKLTLNTNHKS
jgi:hypothetical protein